MLAIAQHFELVVFAGYFLAARSVKFSAM